MRVKFRNTLIEHLLFAVYLVLLGGRKKKKRTIQRAPLLSGFPLVLTTREPQKVRKLDGFNLQLAPCWVVVPEGQQLLHGGLHPMGFSVSRLQ